MRCRHAPPLRQRWTEGGRRDEYDRKMRGSDGEWVCGGGRKGGDGGEEGMRVRRHGQDQGRGRVRGI